MPCLDLSTDDTTITLCRTGVLEIARRVLPCPTCDRRRRMVMLFDSSPWYAPRVECCGCGDAWTEGWRHERPFRRGWRKEAIATAKQHWANAFRLTEGQRRAWFEEHFGPDVETVDTGGLA